MKLRILYVVSIFCFICGMASTIYAQSIKPYETYNESIPKSLDRKIDINDNILYYIEKEGKTYRIIKKNLINSEKKTIYSSDNKIITSIAVIGKKHFLIGIQSEELMKLREYTDGYGFASEYWMYDVESKSTINFNRIGDGKLREIYYPKLMDDTIYFTETQYDDPNQKLNYNSTITGGAASFNLLKYKLGDSNVSVVKNELSSGFGALPYTLGENCVYYVKSDTNIITMSFEDMQPIIIMKSEDNGLEYITKVLASNGKYIYFNSYSPDKKTICIKNQGNTSEHVFSLNGGLYGINQIIYQDNYFLIEKPIAIPIGDGIAGITVYQFQKYDYNGNLLAQYPYCKANYHTLGTAPVDAVEWNGMIYYVHYDDKVFDEDKNLLLDCIKPLA